jgi:hypothetical protein
MRAALLLLSILALLGCVAGLEPDVGELRVGICAPEDSDPDHDVSFMDDVKPLLDRQGSEGGCRCHSPMSPKPIGIEMTGLNLGSYAGLMRGGRQSGQDIVVPGDPCASIVVQKVSSAPPFGARMPSSGPPYMTPAERQLLSDWIAEGAHDN